MNTAIAEKARDVNIGLSEGDRSEAARLLGRILADEFVLYAKTRNFHWNVIGPGFSELHKLFEALYEEQGKIVDETAERIRAIDKPAPGSLAEFLKQARLKEAPGALAEGSRLVAALLEDHEALSRTLRQDVSAC